MVSSSKSHTYFGQVFELDAPGQIFIFSSEFIYFDIKFAMNLARSSLDFLGLVYDVGYFVENLSECSSRALKGNRQLLQWGRSHI